MSSAGTRNDEGPVQAGGVASGAAPGRVGGTVSAATAAPRASGRSAAPRTSRLLPFAEALVFAQSLGLASRKEWEAWCKGGMRPTNVPANPRKSYKVLGWLGWGHWLGTGTQSSQATNEQFLPFEAARAVAQSLHLAGAREWEVWCQTDLRPRNVPTTPGVTYKQDGWRGMCDWLGKASCPERLAWQPHEDALLRTAKEKFDGLFSKGACKAWARIAESVEGRTGPACERRWTTALSRCPGPATAPWSTKEDALLRRLVEKQGPGLTSWVDIAARVEGRTPQQCRDRGDAMPWTEDESRIAADGHAKLGCKWGAIAKLLPGRSSVAVQKHWTAACLQAQRGDTFAKVNKERKRRLLLAASDEAAAAAAAPKAVVAEAKVRVRDGPDLYNACWQDHHATARLLLAGGADPNRGGDGGATPLYVAAQHGHGHCVRELLAVKGTNVNQAPLSSGATPLSAAVQHGSEECARLLLADRRVDANQEDAAGRSPLHHAASRNGHNACVALLLSVDRVNANQGNTCGATRGAYEFGKGRPRLGRTPLHVASHDGNAGAARLLLAHVGIKVNAVDEVGTTALYCACSEGHHALAALLVADSRVKINLAVSIPQPVRDPDAGSAKQSADDAAPAPAHSGTELHQARLDQAARSDQARLGTGGTPLWIACARGHEGCARVLLRRKRTDPNQALANGVTPLYAACDHGHDTCARLLLATAGTDQNRTTVGGYTPLYTACHQGHEGCARLLLAAEGTDRNRATDNGGSTPLFAACQNGHEACVRLLLVMGGGVLQLNHHDKYGRTPLFAACDRGQEACARLLLAADGTDQNLASNGGSTPLHAACQNGHEACVRLLLAHAGTDQNQARDDGCTPLFIACQEGRGECAQLLLAHAGTDQNLASDGSATPLFAACENGHVACAGLLLAHAGTDQNQAMDGGYTPLFIACQKGRGACARLLLAHAGTEQNRATDTGATPLYIACCYGHEACAGLLLAHAGTEQNQAMGNGCTPLFVACQNGHEACVRLLLGAAGTDQNHAKNDGSTPLYMACHQGHEGCARLLLAAAGTRANAPMAGGWTPLHKACVKEGNPDVAALVLVGGGDRFAKTTEHGKTPLQLTTSKAIRELFRLGIDYWQRRRQSQHSHATQQAVVAVLLVRQRLGAHAPLGAALAHLPVEIWLAVCTFLRSADFSS